MTDYATIAANAKDAARVLLEEIRHGYCEWYERSVKRIQWLWLPLYLFGLLSGFATAIVAALAGEDDFRQLGWVRLTLILLPSCGAAVSTLLLQAQLHRRLILREEGRREFQLVYNEGRTRFSACKNDADYVALSDWLSKRIDAIELKQGEGFYRLMLPLGIQEKEGS